MKNLKKVTNLLFIAAMAMLLSNLFAVSPIVLFVILVSTSLFVPKGMAYMAIQVEIWERDIVGNLFKNNDFAKRAFNADQYVTQGKIVHIPFAGAPSTVNKNQTVFPQVAVSRGDVDVTYAIDTFQTTPRRIANIDKYELSYDKRQSVAGEDQRQLIQVAMNSLLYNWAPAAANVIPTVGNPLAATLPNATNNRAGFTKAVFGQAKLAMDAADIDPNGRIALLTAYHHQQFLDSLSDAERTGYNAAADMKRGVIGMYLGIEVMMRSSVLRYRLNGGVYVPVDEYGATFATDDQTGDCAASLFYQDSTVERAFGGVTMFDNPNRAEYYGDIMSFELRMGGRIRRTAGVYAVVESIIQP